MFFYKNSLTKNFEKKIKFVQIFQNKIQKRKNIVERRYLSVIFGYILEYFDYRFNLKMPYISIQILHGIIQRKYRSVILWNNLEYFIYHLNIEYYIYIDSCFVFSFVEKRYLSVILRNNLE